MELQLQRMTLVLQRVAQCDASASAAVAPAPGKASGAPPPAAQPQLTLDEVEAVYGGLYREYREEYVMYSLGAVALAHALPRLQRLLAGWQPLQEPSRGVAELRRWRALLDPQDLSSSATNGAAAAGPLFGGGGAVVAAGDPYTQLVSELVLPPLRSACTQWQPRDAEPLVSFMELWEPLLPHSTLVHVLDMLVMPALRRAVSEWEPRQETVPIHAWLHPWLPYLGAALEELYPVIRGKLAAALQLWQAEDASALVLLGPWHKVFASQVRCGACQAQCDGRACVVRVFRAVL